MKLFLVSVAGSLCVRERAEELCKALSREKLADSNLEKLYLAGFLRHGFLIKCAFTFPRPLLSTAAFDSLRFLDECFFVAFFVCARRIKEFRDVLINFNTLMKGIFLVKEGSTCERRQMMTRFFIRTFLRNEKFFIV